jgi:hypothetical protein
MSILRAKLKEPEEFFYYDGTETSFTEFTCWQPPMYTIGGIPQKGTINRDTQGGLFLSGWKQIVRIPPKSYIKKKDYIYQACVIPEKEFLANYKKSRIKK